MDSIILPELPTYLFAPNLAGFLSLALTVLLPLGAALLMRQSWSTSAKGTVLLALAAVKAFLEAWLGAATDNATFNVAEVGYAIAVNWGIAVAVYFGFLKGTSVQQAAIRSGVKDHRVIDGEAV